MLLLPIVALVTGKRDTSLLDKLGLGRLGSRIRCPRCQWIPRKQDLWQCAPGCGQMWNTFDTKGCCPGCSTEWQETVCLRCREWSRHDSWYEQPSEER